MISLTRTCWEREIFHAFTTSRLTGVKPTSTSHIAHIWGIAQLTGLYSKLACFGKLYIAIQVRVAIGRANTSFSYQETVAAICQTFSVAKTTFIKSSVGIAELSRELNVSREVFELRTVFRARSIVLKGLVIDKRIAEKSICCIALIVNILNISSLSCRSILLSQAWCRSCLGFLQARSFNANSLAICIICHVGDRKYWNYKSRDDCLFQSFLHL